MNDKNIKNEEKKNFELKNLNEKFSPRVKRTAIVVGAVLAVAGTIALVKKLRGDTFELVEDVVETINN